MKYYSLPEDDQDTIQEYVDNVHNIFIELTIQGQKKVSDLLTSQSKL